MSSLMYSDAVRRLPPPFAVDDRSSRRSGAPDPSYFAGRPQPLDVNLGRSIGPIQPSGQVGFPGFRGPLPDPGLGRLQSGPGTIYPLRTWYEDNDGPWDPVRVIEDKRASWNKGHLPTPRQAGPPPGLIEYRGAVEPSDCDTSPGGIPPSDSGYASAPRPSVGRPSVYGDGDVTGDSQSIAGRFAGLSLPQGPHAEGKDGLRCDHCQQPVKTQSELRKHQNRHTKPFRCNVPGCDRPEGFATTNDRDRHVKSRHPPSGGAGDGYSCTLGTCGTKTKIWPRADNFKQHLRRIHKRILTDDEDVDQFRRDPQPDLTGLDSSNMLSLMDGNLPGPHLMTWMPTDSASDLDSRDALGDGRVLGGDHMSFQDSLEFFSSPISFFPSPGGADSQDLVGGRGANAQLGLDLQNMMGLSHSVGPSQEASLSPARETSPAGRSSFVEAVDLTSPSPSAGSPASSHRSDEEAPEPASGPAPLEPRQTQAQSDAMPQPPRPSGPVRLGPIPGDSRGVEQPAVRKPVTATTQTQDRDASTASDRASPGPDDDASSDTSSSPKAVLSTATKVDVEDLSDNEVSNMIKSLQAKGKLAKYIEGMGYQKTKEPAPKLKKPSRSQASANKNAPHRCPEATCKAAFNRPCELKKHRKRHEKPYGCTYLQCSKKFGSKNDWKRHENSQHLQFEAWKCDERLKLKEGADAVCGKVLPRRETFRSHLQKDHQVSDEKIVEKLEFCRVGQSFEARFWCGFCAKVIEIKQGEQRDPAWSERFDHIEAHYTGRDGYRKCGRSEWKDVSSMPLETLSERQDSASRADGRGKHGADDGQSSRKRSRPGQEPGGRSPKRSRHNYIWTCCQCENYWSWSTSTKCLDAVCEHTKCDECTVEERRRT